MPLNTTIHAALKTQATSYGFWLTLPSAPLAKTALRCTAHLNGRGFDWVLIDAEHGLITDKDYYELSNVIASGGASPVIRVPCAEEWMIKRALDAGAHGILAPMCHSAGDAAKVVSYCKYPPLGTRGYGPAFAGHSFPEIDSNETYDQNADNDLLIAVQIESVLGVEHVNEIAQVKGLDVLLIGPFDLAKQMGIARGCEEHETAIQKVLMAAKDGGKKAAIFCSNSLEARIRTEQGFDMVSITTDSGLFESAMARELDLARGQKIVEPRNHVY